MPRILVTGAGGQLGQDLVDAFCGRVPPGGLRCSLYGPPGERPGTADVVAAAHRDLPVERRWEVLQAVEDLRPDIVVHAAAWTAVDDCELDPQRAYAVNAFGTRNVAEACRRYGAHLVYLSTDYVFDGLAGRPYTEWDEPRPLSVYGRSKLGGERECQRSVPDCSVIRTSWVCGARGHNMVKTALRLARGSEPLRFVDDQHGSPTLTADLAPAVVTVALERLAGTFHLTNSGATSWFGLVREVLARSGGDPARVEPIATSDLEPPRPAPRPPSAVLDNAAARAAGLPPLPAWEDGLVRLLEALAPTEALAGGGGG